MRGRNIRPLPAPANRPGAAPSFLDFLAGFDDQMEAREPGWKARQANLKAERARAAAEFRASTIAKYGSVEAVLAPCKPAQALAAATEHLNQKIWKTYANGRFEVDSLDGWAGSIMENPPPSVVLAVSSAYPLPANIIEAKAEVDHWSRREAEIRAAGNYEGDEVLDLPCLARRDIVRRLFEKDLPVRTIEDLHARLKLAAETEDAHQAAEITTALLPDFERLVLRIGGAA